MKENHSLKNNEKGAILVTFFVMLIALLLSVGLVVDSGLLYIAQLTVKKATDAATLAGMARLVEAGPAATRRADADAIAREVFTQNLLLEGYEVADIASMTVNIAADERRLRFEGAVQAPVLIMDILPGVMDSQVVLNASEAQSSNVIVALSLDTSGSMICPVGDGTIIGTGTVVDTFTCNCFPNCPAGLPATDPNRRKIEILQDAVVDGFLASFAAPDLVGLATFNRVATLQAEAGFNTIASTPTTVGTVRALIQNSSGVLADVSDLTNTSDALFTGFQSIARAAANDPDATVAHLIFSDGAPTAGRFRFNSPTAALPANDSGSFAAPFADVPGFNSFDGNAGSAREYYVWNLTWQFLDQLIPGLSVPELLGASVPGNAGLSTPPFTTQYAQDSKGSTFTTSGGVTTNSFGDEFPFRAPVAFNDPACSEATLPIIPNPVVIENIREDGIDEFGSCLNNLQFLDPAGNAFPDNPAVNAQIDDFDQAYYLNAIAMADWLRSQGHVVYGIAMGPVSNQVDDPFNEIGNKFVRKDNFFRRITLEPVAPDRAASVSNPALSARVAFPGMPDVEGLLQDPQHTSGVFFPATPGSDLTEIFSAVAKIIKLRLVRFVP